MFEIANFTSGLVPNAGWSRARNAAAQDQSDLRPSDQGFLEDRAAHRTVYDDDALTQVFAYKTLLLGIIDEELKWARARPRGETVEFQSFSPVAGLNTTDRWQFQPIKNATGEYIFMGNGHEVYLIDLDGVFDDNPLPPSLDPFYIDQQPNAPTYTVNELGTDEPDHLERNVIVMRTQYVEYKDRVRVAVSEPSEPARIEGVNILQQGSARSDLDNTRTTRTAITVHYNLPQGSIRGDRVELYFSEPFYDPDNANTAADENRPMYLVSSVEIPASGTIDQAHTLRVERDAYGRSSLMPQQGERVDWGFIETDGLRSYAAQPGSDNLYLSLFDPETSDRLFRNFADTIALPIDGERITGLKFLREGLLAVYTPHRIVLVATDPLPELCQVTSVYTTGPNDEPVGCIAPESLVQAGAYHYFLSSNYWVYRFGSQNPVWVSASVQPILDTVAVPEEDDASLALINAQAVFHQGHYVLSIPSLSHDPLHHFLTWRGNQFGWRRRISLEWRDNLYRQNTTLLYEYRRNRWYKDGFGVESFAKDERDRLYGVVGGELLALYDDPDSDSEALRVWQSNQILIPPRTQIFNVFVKSQIPATLTVTVKTESGTETSDLFIEDVDDYWASHMGCQLYGRTVQVTVESKGPLLLDRISINEEQAM